MTSGRLGWLGGGLVVVGLALIVVGSTVGGIAGNRQGGMIGPGGRMAPAE